MSGPSNELHSEASRAQDFLRLKDLFLPGFFGICSSNNIVNVDVVCEHTERQWEIIPTENGKPLDCHCGLVSRAAHAVPGSRHDVYLRLGAVVEGWVVEKERVGESRLLQIQPVVQLGDVGCPRCPLGAQTDQNIWDLCQHILTLGQNQVEARATWINNQSARCRHAAWLVHCPPRIVVPEGSISDALLDLIGQCE